MSNLLYLFPLQYTKVPKNPNLKELPVSLVNRYGVSMSYACNELGLLWWWYSQIWSWTHARRQQADCLRLWYLQ